MRFLKDGKNIVDIKEPMNGRLGGTISAKVASKMSKITIQEAQVNLFELIHQLLPGEEVVITENNQPVARLLPNPNVHTPKPRQLGKGSGTVLFMAPDFDAPLDDLKAYMESNTSLPPIP